MTFNNNELNAIYYNAINNNINKIKELLLTKQGIEFIKNLNKTENQKLWTKAIKLANIQLLKGLKALRITMKLSNGKLGVILKSLDSVNHYETYVFLFDNYITLNDNNAIIFIFRVLYYLKTPNNKKQQNMQLKIIKKLCKFQSVKRYLYYFFDDVIKSLNVRLVHFVIKEIKINIDEKFYGYSILQVVVRYLNTLNINNMFAYETFDYLLSIGADIHKTTKDGNDIYTLIDRIIDPNVRKNIHQILLNYEIIKITKSIEDKKSKEGCIIL